MKRINNWICIVNKSRLSSSDGLQTTRHRGFYNLGKMGNSLLVRRLLQLSDSTCDGKSLQSSLACPSIINKSSADWILSIRWCHGAICPEGAAWHCGLNHKCNSCCNAVWLFHFHIIITTTQYGVSELGRNMEFQVTCPLVCRMQVCSLRSWPFY